jgi:hypothetical protein
MWNAGMGQFNDAQHDYILYHLVEQFTRKPVQQRVVDYVTMVLRLNT